MVRVGIDLGGTNIVTGLVTESMTILDRLSVPTLAPRSMESIADDIGKSLDLLLQRNGLSRADVAAVGMGVPGTANEENGHIEDANNLDFDDVDAAGILEKELCLPVRLVNDANAAAWGEYLVCGYAEDSMLMVTLGTGIGGGIILDRKLWTGVNFAAGEFGHMTLCLEGEPCSCGRKGCFEAYGSATALIAQARRHMAKDPDTLLWKLCGGNPEKVEARTVFDGAAAKDPASMDLLDRYTTYLAEGISGLINIFQPALVCVGGGVSHAGDALLVPLREKVAKLILTQNAKRNTRIVPARLGNDAGLLGAALL